MPQAKGKYIPPHRRKAPTRRDPPPQPRRDEELITRSLKKKKEGEPAPEDSDAPPPGLRPIAALNASQEEYTHERERRFQLSLEKEMQWCNEEQELVELLKQRFPEFNTWLDVKSQGGHSEHLAKYFASHHGVIWEKQTKTVITKRKRNSDATSIMKLYRFYAVDIDMGLQITQELQSKFENDEFLFLDVGFAPGGLSRYFLKEIPTARGFGISLPFEEMGNPVSDDIDWMVFRKRYKYELCDVAALCREDVKIGEKLGCAAGVNMVILDVNNHSKSHRHNEVGEERTTMKQLGTSQLWTGLKYLKDGGDMLIRLSIGSGVYTLHTMWLLTRFFTKFRSAKPTYKFIIHKSYYVFCSGFKRSEYVNSGLEERLREIVLSTTAYRVDPETNSSLGPQMTSDSIVSILDNFGTDIYELWKNPISVQCIALQEAMEGKKDAICAQYSKCRRGSDCRFAHKTSDVISIVLAGLEKQKLVPDWIRD